MHALEVCDDDILALAINLYFACSVRMGEMLGLTSVSDTHLDVYKRQVQDGQPSECWTAIVFVPSGIQRIPTLISYAEDQERTEQFYGTMPTATTLSLIHIFPMAHQLIGFYTVADDSDGVLKVMRSYQYFAASAISDRCV